MIIEFLFQNFEVISLTCLFIIVFSSVCIFFIQNKFIKKTDIKLDKYNELINRNGLDLAEYIKTNYPNRDFVIEVSEDGENGCECHYVKDIEMEIDNEFLSHHADSVS